MTIDFTSTGDFSSTLWDEGLLRHILGNLITNAIKYSYPDSKVEFELTRQEKTVMFKIEDWGIGIPKKDQKQIFLPFHRGENVGSISGTSMGLAIVKKCVEAHGGEIYFNSQVGMGTTFIVTLPLRKISDCSILKAVIMSIQT